MIYNQIVTWTAFAILAMFFTSPPPARLSFIVSCITLYSWGNSLESLSSIVSLKSFVSSAEQHSWRTYKLIMNLFMPSTFKIALYGQLAKFANILWDGLKVVTIEIIEIVTTIIVTTFKRCNNLNML